MFRWGLYSPLLVHSEKKKKFIQFQCSEIFEVPLFGSDDMEAYFHVLTEFCDSL